MSSHSLRDIFVIKKIPTIPSIGVKIAKQTENFQFDPVRLAEQVRFDVGLTSKFVAKANSLSNGLREFSSIQSSIMACGPQHSHEILLGRFLIENDPRLARFQSMFEFGWSICISQSIAAELLCEFEFSEGVNTMFLTGLISDLGVIALMQTYPEEYHDQVWQPLLHGKEIRNLQDLERATFGFSHVTVGHELGRHWRIGESLSSAILQHHQKLNGGFFSMISQAAAMAIEVLDSQTNDCEVREDLEEHLEVCFRAKKGQVERYLEKVAERRIEIIGALGLPVPRKQNTQPAVQLV